MTEVFFTTAEDVHEKLSELIYNRLHHPFKLLKTGNGKPYIEGNEVYFNLTHTGGLAFIAIASSPIGIDAELICEKERASVKSRLSDRELAIIKSEEDFLKNWTAKESYVKFLGEKIAVYFKRLEYLDGKMFLDGKEVFDKFCSFYHNGAVVTVCGDDEVLFKNIQ